MPQMIIANRLEDGLTVFLADGRRWVERIDDGVLIEADAEEDRLLALAKTDEDNCIVIDPYLIEVTSDGGRLRPAVYREEIRAFGPSVRTDLLAAAPGE